MKGDWHKINRSLIPEFPITVFTSGTFLYIESISPDRDITIHIIDETTGEIEYEEAILEEQTAYITISTVDFATGKYKIEILDFAEGYLVGYFTKY